MSNKTIRKTPTKPAGATPPTTAQRKARVVKAKPATQLSLFDYAACMGISLLRDAS